MQLRSTLSCTSGNSAGLFGRDKRLLRHLSAQLEPSVISKQVARLRPYGTRNTSAHRLLVTAAASASLQQGVCAGMAAVFLAGTPLSSQAALELPKGQLPRTAEIALRRSVPAFNADVKEIQDRLEDIALKLRIPQRKPWNSMASSLSMATDVAAKDAALLVGVLPPNEAEARQLVADIQKGLERLADAVSTKDPDRTSIRVANLLEQVGKLELLQAPGLPFNLPRQYDSLPRLIGRAEVELKVQRSLGDSQLEDSLSTTSLRLVLDGYSAPLTAGNFVANVLDGVYNGAQLSTTYNSVLVGDEDASAPAIPLEMLAVGDFEPQYRASLDVRGGERPVLPFSINGAVAMALLINGDDDLGLGDGIARSVNGMVSGRQFFVHKFDRARAGLAGLSFDEGEFGVFGYVVEGNDWLSRLQGGDKITSATVISGADKLVRPSN